MCMFFDYLMEHQRDIQAIITQVHVHHVIADYIGVFCTCLWLLYI